VRKFEEGLDKDAVCHRFFFKSHSECLIKEGPEGCGDFNIGQAILTAKNAGGLVLLAKKETVLQGMIDRLVEWWKLWSENE